MKTILVDAIHTFVIKDSGVFREMYYLLEQYPNKKIIVTNANDEQMVLFGLDKMPYDVFTMKHDPEKTDPKYFQTLLDTFDLRSEDIVYFEHNKDAVESARTVGIVSFYYDPIRKDLNELKSFLDSQLEYNDIS